MEPHNEDFSAAARPALPLLGLLVLAVALGVAAAVGLAGIALALAAPAYGAAQADYRKAVCSPSSSPAQEAQPPEPAEEPADEETSAQYAVLIVVPPLRPRVAQWQM